MFSSAHLSTSASIVSIDDTSNILNAFFLFSMLHSPLVEPWIEFEVFVLFDYIDVTY